MNASRSTPFAALFAPQRSQTELRQKHSTELAFPQKKLAAMRFMFAQMIETMQTPFATAARPQTQNSLI
jgi:hypothetical protein